jgi:hypothetical protein
MSKAGILDEKVYSSVHRYGCDAILRAELGVDPSMVLPIAIPHGIDYYHLSRDLDLHTHEPVYVAFREDIAQRVSRIKPVLRFPHPWLLLATKYEPGRSAGTLFIAPPPSAANFDALWRAIADCGLPKPWGILIKQRGIAQEDFDWWAGRGLAVHTAGATYNASFFYNLRDIFAEYEYVASPNMSSAVIFAVAMDRRAVALPDVAVECVDVPNWDEIVVLEGPGCARILSTWQDLLAEDPARAKARAQELLGIGYMDTATALKARLLDAVASVSARPIHLFPLREGPLYRACVWLIRHGIPAQKLFPSPFAKLSDKLLGLLRLNMVSVCVGSDFAHYGIRGEVAKLKVRRLSALRLGQRGIPGNAVRGTSVRPEERRPG